MWLEGVIAGAAIFLLVNIKGWPGSYHLTVLYLTLRALLSREKVNPVQGATLHFRVWADDLDVYGHMNNSVYHKQADFGRYWLLCKMGVMGYARREKVAVHNGGQFIQFRRSLAPFQRYSLTSRIHSHDDKWLYVEQKFKVGEKTHAVNYVKLVVKRGRETIGPAEALAGMGYPSLPLSSSPLSSLFRSLDSLDTSL